MWQGQSWATRKETLLLLFFWYLLLVWPVAHISVFCLHTILRPSKKWFTYIVCTPLSPGGLSLLPNFQIRGPDRMSIFRGRLLEKRRWLFWAGGGRDRSCNIKNKTKIWNFKRQKKKHKKLQTKMFICHN